MPLKIVTGDIFSYNEEWVPVIPTNCIGIFGAGLARDAIKRKEYRMACWEYARECRSHLIDPGSFVFYPFSEPGVMSPRSVAFLATKDRWIDPSKLEWIESGLEEFILQNEDNKIKKLALPAIGCGLGGLKMADVECIVKRLLGPLDDVLTHFIRMAS